MKVKLLIFVSVIAACWSSIGSAENRRHATFKLSACMERQLTERLYNLDGTTCPFSLDLGGKVYAGQFENRTDRFVLNSSEIDSAGRKTKADRQYALFRGIVKRGQRRQFDGREITRFGVAASVLENGKKFKVTVETPRFVYQGRASFDSVIGNGELRLKRLRRKLHGLNCGSDGHGAFASAPVRSPSSSEPKALPIVSPVLQIYARADYDASYKTKNNNDGAGAAAAQFNEVDAIYGADLGLKMTLIDIVGGTNPTTNPANSTDAGKVLTAFQTFVNDSGTPAAHVHHFLSGRNYDSGVIGLAYLGVVCVAPEYSAGLSQYFEQGGTDYTYLVIAHEIGHNLNAVHTECDAGGDAPPNCMCNPVTGVSPSGCIPYVDSVMSAIFNTSGDFYPFSVDQITDFVENQGGGSCLEDQDALPPGDDDDDDVTPGDDDDDNGGGSGGGGIFDPNRPDYPFGPLARIKTEVEERIRGNGRASYDLKIKITGNPDGLKDCSLGATELYASTRRGEIIDASSLSSASAAYLGSVDMNSVPESIYLRVKAGAKSTLKDKKPSNRVFFRAVVRNCAVNPLIASDITRLGLGIKSAVGSAIIQSFDNKLP